MKTLILVVAVLAGCGGDDGDASVRTVSNNNSCVAEGTGGQPGDACTTPDDCALIACCACPGGAKMVSAAACNGTCLDEDSACDVALAEGGPMPCD